MLPGPPTASKRSPGLDHPASGNCKQLSRRTLLGFLAAAPLFLVTPTAAETQADVTLHDGWILRPDDLHRLGIK
jgi:hypothetical protein